MHSRFPPVRLSLSSTFRLPIVHRKPDANLVTVANISSQGQTTIPKDVRDWLWLESGGRVEFIVQGDTTAVMVPSSGV